MRRFTCGSLLLVLLVLGSATWVQGQGPVTDPASVEPKKRAQTGMKFLTVAGSPRAAALANSVGALRNGDSRALFVNPASMAEMEGNVHGFASRTRWISDIDYDFASAAYRPGSGRFGVVGLSFVNVSYGEFFRTVRAENEQGYKQLGTYSPTSLALGLGYARSVSDRFSVGGQAKWVHQSLGTQPIRYDEEGQLERRSFEKSVIAYDFGLMYRTGFESLTIGVRARNFAPEVTYVRNSFELPLTMDVAISMNVLDLTSLDPSRHALKVYSSFSRPRDFYEQVRLGGEYLFLETVALRAGYSAPNDVRGINLGAGLQHELAGVDLGFDYSYTQFDVFSAVNRLSLSLSF